jgi:hypothetical protein
VKSAECGVWSAEREKKPGKTDLKKCGVRSVEFARKDRVRKLERTNEIGSESHWRKEAGNDKA